MRESVNSKIQLENVLFKTGNLLLVKVGTKKNKTRTAYIVCEGVSLSVDKYNVPYLWDPYLSIPNEKEFKGIFQGDIFLMYFPFECEGLQQAGMELAKYIDEKMKEYDDIIVIGHSKAGVCIANMARMLKRKCVLLFVSAPFKGTIMTKKEAVKAKVTQPEYRIYEKYYNQHPVDLDIMEDSLFLQKVADLSGVKHHLCINVVSECLCLLTITDVGCMYLGWRIGYKHSDGIVSVSSQESLSKTYPNVKTIHIDASHANSLKRLFSRRTKYIVD